MRPLRDQPRNFDEYSEELSQRVVMPVVVALGTIGLLVGFVVNRAEEVIPAFVIAGVAIAAIGLVAWWQGQLGGTGRWSIPLRRRKLENVHLRCPYCHGDIERGVGLVCGACRAHAHAGCWVELGKCAACGRDELMGLPDGMRSMVRAELNPDHPALRSNQSGRSAQAPASFEKGKQKGA